MFALLATNQPVSRGFIDMRTDKDSLVALSIYLGLTGYRGYRTDLRNQRILPMERRKRPRDVSRNGISECKRIEYGG
jgi:hypothetical protein